MTVRDYLLQNPLKKYNIEYFRVNCCDICQQIFKDYSEDYSLKSISSEDIQKITSDQILDIEVSPENVAGDTITLEDTPDYIASYICDECLFSDIDNEDEDTVYEEIYNEYYYDDDDIFQ